jgi:hypothetical protein
VADRAFKDFRRGPDGLTPKERALVRARIENPRMELWALGKLAGFKGQKRSIVTAASGILKRPRVLRALRDPDTFKFKPENINRAWLLEKYTAIVESAETDQQEKISALNALAKMVPGAIVPVAMDVRSVLTIENFVEAAGGRPVETVQVNQLPS